MGNWDHLTEDDVYAKAAAESQIDSRVGKQQFLVGGIDASPWPSGEPRLKLKGALLTANSASADLTLSPPPSPEVMRTEYPNWEANKKKAVGNAINLALQLRKFYQKSPDQIAVGDEFTVMTAKNKEGYIRIVAFLQPAATSTGESSASSAVPF